MTASDFILPTFFGDALALGPHWIYDTESIRSRYPGGIHEYDEPRSSYHPGKNAGDLTHLGDQTLVLLESLAGHKGSLTGWPADWQGWAVQARDGKTSYFDGATRATLDHLAAGRRQPSESSDLAGAARIAPLFACHGEVTSLVAAARAQTALTHGDPRVIDAAEFFARAAFSIGEGVDLIEAFEEAAFFPYAALPANQWLMAGRHAATELGKSAPALGLGCDITGAFPITLALALCHEDDPVEALSANALLGGDSAARGLLLGLLMGARHGVAAFPADWSGKLRAMGRIGQALETLTS